MNRKECLEKIEVLKKGFSDLSLELMQKRINNIVKIYSQWCGIVLEAIKAQNFEDIDGVDFNDYYHDTEFFIEETYREMTSMYYTKQFEIKGFVAIDW